MASFRCPTCGKPFETEATNAMPFCSHRCRLLDLGRWLDEEQGMPIEPEDREEEQAWEGP